MKKYEEANKILDQLRTCFAWMDWYEPIKTAYVTAKFRDLPTPRWWWKEHCAQEFNMNRDYEYNPFTGESVYRP